MRLYALPPQASIQLDADPEWAESFLGPEPELSLVDAQVWSVYWSARRSTATDAMGVPMPLDLVRALDLYGRLHGEAHPRRLVEKLQAMDGVYLNNRAEAAKRRKTKGG
jgi:hypothetical protein